MSAFWGQVLVVVSFFAPVFFLFYLNDRRNRGKTQRESLKELNKLAS